MKEKKLSKAEIDSSDKLITSTGLEIQLELIYNILNLGFV